MGRDSIGATAPSATPPRTPESCPARHRATREPTTSPTNRSTQPGSRARTSVPGRGRACIHAMGKALPGLVRTIPLAEVDGAVPTPPRDTWAAGGSVSVAVGEDRGQRLTVWFARDQAAAPRGDHNVPLAVPDGLRGTIRTIRPAVGRTTRRLSQLRLRQTRPVRGTGSHASDPGRSVRIGQRRRRLAVAFIPQRYSHAARPCCEDGLSPRMPDASVG
jgi:hypothetical protein